MTQNNLQSETSPYLLQHADNPVDWYPWNEIALELARSSGKPILLSVGYSACHWCHVMAHESFEDEATAAVMNRLFVNIKVDREERPDLDRIYQLSHQILTGQGGGWPLTVFLDPDTHLPFFSGTYFPPAPRHGLPAFQQLLQRIDQWYQENKNELAQQTAGIQAALEQVNSHSRHGDALTAAPIDKAIETLAQRFDPRYGGYDGAPKFPQAPLLEFLTAIQAGNSPRVELAGKMLHTSLANICSGGLQDHLGGGFYRYTVDADWSIPHFEKMLYDNAQLLSLLAPWAADGHEPGRQAAEALVDWLLREMLGAEGGFYSSLDADSEGEEGRFYVWHKEEIRALLTQDQWQPFESTYGLDQPPNFEGRHWHLKQYRKPPESSGNAALEQARAVLFQQRQQRVPPGRDDKQLCSWNALTISALADSGRCLGRQDWIQLAADGFDFIHTKLWRDGRLYASYHQGSCIYRGYLDDYAFLLQAGMTLLRSRWRSSVLEFCIQLADCLLNEFLDADGGGLYFTAHDHETLVQRSMYFHDDATPNGNGIACQALLQLGHLLGESRYLDAAESILRVAWEDINRQPAGHASLLTALHNWLQPLPLLVLIGDSDTTSNWLNNIDISYISTYCIDHNTGPLPGNLANYAATAPVTAYLCRGLRCLPPFTDPEVLRAELSRNGDR